MSTPHTPPNACGASGVSGAPDGRSARTTRTLWAAALGFLAAAGVLTALVAAHWSPLLALDRSWDRALHRTALRHAGWTGSMRMISELGSPTVLRIVLILVAVWLWARGARLTALWVAAVGVVQLVVEVAVKAAVGRSRPDLLSPVAHATGWAFPSGHSMTVATVAPLLVLLLWPHLRRRGRAVAGGAAAAAVLVVSWTRIGLGVHWPSDVLGGWLLAGAVLCGVTAAFGTARPGALAREVGALRLKSSLRVQSDTAPPGSGTRAGR